MTKGWTRRQAEIHLGTLYGWYWPPVEGRPQRRDGKIHAEHSGVCEEDHGESCNVPDHLGTCPGGMPVYRVMVGTMVAAGYTYEHACRNMDHRQHLRSGRHPPGNCEECTRIKRLVRQAIPSHYEAIARALALSLPQTYQRL